MSEKECNDNLKMKIVRLEERLHAAVDALAIARQDIDRRLAGMNELRDQINKERSQYLSRDEYYAKNEVLSTQLMTLQKFQWMVTGALIVFQLLIAFLLHYWQ